MYGSIGSPLQVNRVQLAELIIHSAWVVAFPLSVKRRVSGTRQRILHALRAKSPELVREAQVAALAGKMVEQTSAAGAAH